MVYVYVKNGECKVYVALKDLCIDNDLSSASIANHFSKKKSDSCVRGDVIVYRCEINKSYGKKRKGSSENLLYKRD